MFILPFKTEIDHFEISVKFESIANWILIEKQGNCGHQLIKQLNSSKCATKQRRHTICINNFISISKFPSPIS